MKKKIILTIIILVILSVGLLVGYGLGIIAAQPKVVLNANLENTYTVLKGDRSTWISSLIWSNAPNEWKVSTPQGGTSVPIGTKQMIDVIVRGGGGHDFYCGSKKADSLLYYSRYVPYASGGWESISVIDCGNYYFIYEASDAAPILAGPFDK